MKNNESFCVSLELNKNKKIKYTLYPIVYDGEKVNLNKGKNYKDLSEILKNKEEYKKLINKLTLQNYKYYQNYYYKVTVSDRGSLKERVKGLIKKYIFRYKFQDIWLYHNISIETHLWICKRATRLILKKNKIL